MSECFVAEITDMFWVFVDQQVFGNVRFLTAPGKKVEHYEIYQKN